MLSGATLSELGESMGISRQYLHQLENGTRHPNKDTINALAEHLLVVPEFFGSTIATPIAEDKCHFRKLRTTPVAEVRRVIAHATILGELVAFLDEKLSLPPISFPSLATGSIANIEQAAEECRVQWGLSKAAPIHNMTRVVENAGAVVTTFDSVSTKVDALSVDSARPIIVRSTSKKNYFRTRFDIAHEYGHLVLHQGIETGDKKTESEANRFASAFLLPRSAFLAEFKFAGRFNWDHMYQLKLRWGTSVAAIIRRAYDLKLINAKDYQRASIHLSKTGQRKFEYLDDAKIPEEPELLASALDILSTAYGIDSGELSTVLGIKESLLIQITGTSLPSNVLETELGDNIVKFPVHRRHRKT